MGSTVVSTFFEQTRKLSDAIALRHKRDGEWVTISWTQYGDLVRRAAGGFRSLGIDAGDRGAILSTNRYEWHVADIAIQSCGGITVPIYPTNSPIQEYLCQLGFGFISSGASLRSIQRTPLRMVAALFHTSALLAESCPRT